MFLIKSKIYSTTNATSFLLVDKRKSEVPDVFQNVHNMLLLTFSRAYTWRDLRNRADRIYTLSEQKPNIDKDYCLQERLINLSLKSYRFEWKEISL